MLDENVEDSDANLVDFWELGQNVARDQMKPSVLGREGDRFLVPERQLGSCGLKSS